LASHVEPTWDRPEPDAYVTDLRDAIIVTHNKRDFDSARQYGVKIMSPAEVLALKVSL